MDGPSFQPLTPCRASRGFFAALRERVRIRWPQGFRRAVGVRLVKLGMTLLQRTMYRARALMRVPYCREQGFEIVLWCYRAHCTLFDFGMRWIARR